MVKHDKLTHVEDTKTCRTLHVYAHCSCAHESNWQINNLSRCNSKTIKSMNKKK